jgi:hypothetical protein
MNCKGMEPSFVTHRTPSVSPLTSIANCQIVWKRGNEGRGWFASVMGQG